MKVEVQDFQESHDGFSVYAKIEGEKSSLELRHGFPKGEGYLEEDENGVPRFVEELKEDYRRHVENSVESEGVEGKSAEDYKREYDV